ncbi:MAG: hypothetical protein ABEJ23_09145 [Haloarculaceae archaeon]
MSDTVALGAPDEAILTCLRDHGPEVEPLVASRTGLHLKYARKRCAALLAAGYIEELDAGYYDLAERGARYLSADRPTGQQRPANAD